MSVELIKSKLKSIPKGSGVYQFLDGKKQVLYVGKAKNLRKRIESYTRKNQLNYRIARMVSLAKDVEITQTSSETDALLLEHNLIKKFQPRFNILLRDDKTFAQILFTDHKFPLVKKYRGARSDGGTYFGPFASGFDVNRTIDILRKIFRLRSCSDSDFKSRKKPCLEYQIKKCSAPCVGLISQEDYQNSVSGSVAFMKGKSQEIQQQLQQKMQKLSDAMDYENAANVRDQIKSLNAIQSKQNINLTGIDDVDVITIVEASHNFCVYINFFRGGQNFGAKPYFYLGTRSSRPQNSAEVANIKGEELIEEAGYNSVNILENFLGQFYLDNIPPATILLNLDLEETEIFEEFFSKISQSKIKIITPKRGEKMDIIRNQEEIARRNLEQKVSNNLSIKELHVDIKKVFNLPKIPQKIEVYDNSHTSGTNAVGALISAGLEGFIKNGYRKFNIGKDEFAQGNKDDSSMMTEVLTRRFSKLKKSEFPDLIILDGGKPQLGAAQKVFDELKVKIPFIAMAKGEDRNAGKERFFAINEKGETIEVAADLSRHSPLMYYLQRLRDEAHRFAIMTHRKRRSKNLMVNG